MEYNRTDLMTNANPTTSVEWYKREEDKKIDAPTEQRDEDSKEEKAVLVENSTKPICSELDLNLKQFIHLCDEMEKIITIINRERDGYRLNEEYSSFRKDIHDIKNNAIVEAYERNCFEWKFN